MSSIFNIPYGFSDLVLERVLNAGFKPIAVTVLMCEDTFIFETVEEAIKAWLMFRPYGFWYGKEDFIKDYKAYCRHFKSVPKIYKL